jgi:hypothetical protein
MEKGRRKIKALGDDKEFPGYPMYAPDEDIMKKGKRLEGNLDDESLTEAKNTPAHVPTAIEKVEMPEGIEDNATPRNESDVTAEDLEALGPKDLSMDMNDDEQLKHRQTPVDFAGKDLDIPGSELDDDKEAVGSEDEENNSYSLGGDNHNNLEEARD